jgi:hypothetical protein
MKLGLESISIPQGRYSLSFDNFEHGEALVPIIIEEIKLDYHSEYGEINKMDFQVGREPTLDAFLEYLNIPKSKLKDYSITEFNHSGIANAEHLIDGKIVNVWHKYENEPAVLFEAELEDGSYIASLRINACGNMASWEAELWEHLLVSHSWFFDGYKPCCP